MSDTTAGSSGINLLGALLILFIGLKLTGHIDWPWVLVLAPVLFPLAAALVVFVTVALFSRLKREDRQ